jgi:hypothetical protein
MRVPDGGGSRDERGRQQNELTARDEVRRARQDCALAAAAARWGREADHGDPKLVTWRAEHADSIDERVRLVLFVARLVEENPHDLEAREGLDACWRLMLPVARTVFGGPPEPLSEEEQAQSDRRVKENVDLLVNAGRAVATQRSLADHASRRRTTSWRITGRARVRRRERSAGRSRGGTRAGPEDSDPPAGPPARRRAPAGRRLGRQRRGSRS